jgi:F0F1-type ATP synthase assembly protein I
MAIEEHRVLKTLDPELADKLLAIISPVVKDNTVIYRLRVWIGSAIFALGVAGAVWFVRNLFRGRTKRAMVFYGTNTFMMITFILAFIIGGMWIHSDLRLIPLIGLVLGLIIGWIISR